MILETKYDEVVVYAHTVEQTAISQIIQMANSPLGENAHIRIMPDCHAGAGCVIGTTMKITDKVCPNLVGVDIGCGVLLVHTDIKFEERFAELDSVIRTHIPYGLECHKDAIAWDFSALRCWQKLDKDTQMRATMSLGTLGGGNHFIEAYDNGWLAVHSGSRNIGYKVAEYYQGVAEQRLKERNKETIRIALSEVPPIERESWLAANHVKIDSSLAYLEGEDLQDYLHDVGVMQQFANDNRTRMIQTILTHMNGHILGDTIYSVHNYIDLRYNILRKGAISAQRNEKLVIPLNMRDGVLICIGKGNDEWNYSAPHGAGRLYSRSEAKKSFTIEEYQEAMKGIYTTCINERTLDEAPFVYKDWEEIMSCIEPTVEVIKRLLPIYNFKAD